MRTLCQIALLCLAIALPGEYLRAAPSVSGAASFQLTGAVVKPGAWDAARLRRDLAQDIAAITYTLKGQHHTAHAIPLIALLQAAQPRFNPNIKNHRLQFVILVRGKDGYTAAFSLAELSPDLGRQTAWLALDEDGKPLPEENTPAQLLVPGDAKPARWVHGVAVIIVRDEASASGGL